MKNTIKITNCTEGEARLVNGPSAYKGRLEVCIRSAWATVCSSGFGYEESQVVCGQLGYQRYGMKGSLFVYFDMFKFKIVNQVQWYSPTPIMVMELDKFMDTVVEEVKTLSLAAVYSHMDHLHHAVTTVMLV